MMLAALKSYYDRHVSREVGTRVFGYGDALISFALVIDRNGRPIDVEDLRLSNGKKSRPIELVVPKDFEDRTSGDFAPRAFWDKKEYIFGVSDKPERAARRFRNFAERQRLLIGASSDVGLGAFLAYLSNWDPHHFQKLRYASEMDPEANVVFRLDGDSGFIHDRIAAKAVWEGSLLGSRGCTVKCLVSRQEGTVARLHPLIKGIARPGQPTPKLVAFDKDSDAFDSFGKKQGENAPITEQTAFAYTTALNAMLRHGSRNKLQIADATTVFWAEAVTANEAAAAEETFSWLAEPPADDRSETTQVRQFIEKIAKGRPLTEARPEVAPDTRFCILGLSPNAARISVRFWHDTTLGQLAERFVEHWRDLAIEPPPRNRTPAIWALLYEIATQRKSENIPPRLAGEVMRAILSGVPYPRMLLAQVIMRIRADHSISDLRVAILKACLARDHRLGIEKESISVSLDRENLNPGYRLGRLFAVLESAQRAALPGLNATIRDRFYGAASATPASVFPILIRNTGNHLANLRKGDKPGLGGWLEKEMGEIIAGIGGDFPRSLSLQDQGRFAIGYYHQRFAKGAGKPAGVEETPDDEDDNA